MGGASTRQAPRAGAVFTPRARCAHTVGRRASSSSATRLTFGGCGCRTDPPLGRSRSERCWESMVGGSKSSGPSQTPTRPPSLSASPLSKRGPSTCADIAEMPPRCRRDAAEMPPRCRRSLAPPPCVWREPYLLCILPQVRRGRAVRVCAARREMALHARRRPVRGAARVKNNPVCTSRARVNRAPGPK